jgi:hypothetical protein
MINIRNEQIRKEFLVTDTTTRIKGDETKWWEYAKIMEDKRIQKILFKYNLSDKIRPQKRWKDQFLI